MTYNDVITVSGNAGVVNRTIPIDTAVSSPLLTPVVMMLAPLTGQLSAILMPQGFSWNIVAGAVELTIPNSMAKGKYTVQLPKGLTQYVELSFVVETFPSNGVRDD